ncbi:hypothetical protein GGR50DRAFT_402905 [Xylaria sp. CBS 124048]|nr:hypothetical protein GGR50DRAFT_402905 [Xylaria sp. CBS 124048]
MAVRYTAEVLIHLKDSPLCVKPANLPPAEEWMGPPTDHFRNNQASKPGTERTRHHESAPLDPSSRRSLHDRHASRNNASPEDIVLGPPRTTFTSATLSRTLKPSDNDKTPKDADARDRFPLRTRTVEAESNERVRERERDNRTNFRRRGDSDQDGEGWNTVKPRTSFGNEGAEKFQHRIGERPGPDRRPREGEDREGNAERPRRNFGEFAREKEGSDGDKLRRNGLNRTRTDNPWSRDNGNNNNNIITTTTNNNNNNSNSNSSTNEAPPQSQARERFDRSKSWRDRADEHSDMQPDKPKDRQYDRRWDRDREQRQEREPEWLDVPIEESPRTHTQEDFKRFMESMKARSSSKPEATPTLAQDVLKQQEQYDFDVSKSKPANLTRTLELGPDKFFAAFGQKAAQDASNGDTTKENAAPMSKPKSGSRFQNFFSSQEQARLQPEPPVSPTGPPAAEINPLFALTSSPKANTQPDAAEKVAFQALLEKLQKQTLQASTPPSAGFSEPPPNQDFGSKNAVMSPPGHFQSFGHDHREEAMPHVMSHAQEIHIPPPQQNTQFTGMRAEQQMLHDLIGQRHLNQTSGGNRSEQPSSRNSNPNTEFLVSLMQGGRNVPEAQRNEQLVMRMPQPSRPAHIPPTPDREPDFQHERSSLQHQANVRPAALHGFFDEHLHRQERDVRPQPTHILQRPGQGPLGLDQMPPNNWMQTSGQQLPAPGRPMIPPPGLPGSQRTGPLPGNYANFPLSGFPHPDAMAGPPPRNMAPPPGFFGGPPPPGFMLHPEMGGFQGPNSLAYGFDGRGMPPPGSGAPFRRN